MKTQNFFKALAVLLAALMLLSVPKTALQAKAPAADTAITLCEDNPVPKPLSNG